MKLLIGENVYRVLCINALLIFLLIYSFSISPLSQISLKKRIQKIINLILNPLLFLMTGYLINILLKITQPHAAASQYFLYEFSFYFIFFVEFTTFCWLFSNIIHWGLKRIKNWTNALPHVAFIILILVFIDSLESIFLLSKLHILLPIFKINPYLEFLSQHIREGLLIFLIFWVAYKILYYINKYLVQKNFPFSYKDF